MGQVAWRFHGYVTATGSPDVEQWIDDLDEEARDELEDVLAYLRISHVEDWKRPYFAPMGDGMNEIRFKASNVEYRIFGAFGPSRNQFTMLVGATKTHGKGRKRNKYAPKSARETARKRKGEMDRGSARSRGIDV